MLDGLEGVAEEIFDLPVRRGDVCGVGGLADRVNTPDFATTVGLIHYGYGHWKEKGGPPKYREGFWNKFKNWVKDA